MIHIKKITLHFTHF